SGADALAGRVRQELYAAGARPRTTALRGPDALTPSERRVADRAAAGQTNRAIAEALFVTPKTVELHLRNAYRKLGARNRHAPGAAAAPPPPTPRPGCWRRGPAGPDAPPRRGLAQVAEGDGAVGVAEAPGAAADGQRARGVSVADLAGDEQRAAVQPEIDVD